MKNHQKLILILFVLACNLLIIPEYSLGEDEYEVDPVSAFFSPELLIGQNFTWKVQEWYGMQDWLRQDTTYEPKLGDLWTMTIIGDLSQVILTITSLEFIGFHYEPFNLPKLSEYLQFNISGHSFDEVFGNSDAEEYNWLMLSRLFLIPYTIEDGDGNTKNASSFAYATLENFIVNVTVDLGKGDLILEGSIEGQYETEHIDLNCSLGLRESFSYKKTSVETNLITGGIEIIIEQNEFNPNPPDDENDNDPNKEDSPFDISSYPYLVGCSIIAVIILVKTRRKKILK